ncbi:hypothetical protein DFJ63DRAFT_103513 [Scheffersomyces coipomensis]|uniref:uncharacterized protein n=1 Tax=Scheffersomyces coipomensis TaxID=1788519 RepID=UPI00315D5E44
MKSINKPLVYLVLAVLFVTLLYSQIVNSSTASSSVLSTLKTSTTTSTTSTYTDMSVSDIKSYIITLKDSVSDADVAAVHAKVAELGGTITTKYTLIKGFVAKLPAIHATTFQDHDHIASIEEDSEVKIQ